VDSIGKTRELLQAAPKIEAQKGGRALRGIGETFKANPITGSASISVPLPLSPGRNERTPALSLSYDSGGGNGPYGLGWSLSLPQFQRRSDQKLPRYRDGTDTFVMSALEDLVPVGAPTVAGGVVTQRYQPRAEGGFALIERRIYLDGESTWLTLDRANVRRSYGTTATARLTDLLQPWRTFIWYLTEEWDELGNGVRYVYESGDDPGRGSAFRYLQRVHYGNVTPGTFNDGWRFEVVLDYGGHAATPGDLQPHTDQLVPMVEESDTPEMTVLDAVDLLVNRVPIIVEVHVIRSADRAGAVERLGRTLADAVTGWSNTTRYAYHHGYFDGTEREFRGFGKVEQWDTEATTDGDLPPVRNVTWFHTGACPSPTCKRRIAPSTSRTRARSRRASMPSRASFSSLNLKGQAEAMERYYLNVKKIESGVFDRADTEELARLRQYVLDVQRGIGASAW
jgi:hypothetical protein